MRAEARPSPDTVLILTPSPWERNLAASWAEDRGFQDGYVAAESESALTRRDRRVWRKISRLTDDFCPLADVISQGSPSEALCLGVAEAQTGVAARSRADGEGRGEPSGSARLRSGCWISSPPAR